MLILSQTRRGRREHDWSCHVRIGRLSKLFHRNKFIADERIQVQVGHDNLMGEVIRIEADRATIQVYEETGENYVRVLLLRLADKL